MKDYEQAKSELQQFDDRAQKLISDIAAMHAVTQRVARISLDLLKHPSDHS
jgi:hypothetical protein